MCGRFTLAKPLQQIEELVGEMEGELQLPPRYNIAPTQPVLTVLNTAANRLTFTQWGLVPHGAKDPAIGSRMINARAETVARKPSFRSSFKRKRCLILADGFFEWAKVEGGRYKRPMYIRLTSGKPFAFAALYADWQGSDGTKLTTSTILTTVANKLVSRIHHRMPVIIPREDFPTWLNPDIRQPDDLTPLLDSYPASRMETYEVSSRVNNARHDAPDCIEHDAKTPESGELF